MYAYRESTSFNSFAKDNKDTKNGNLEVSKFVVRKTFRSQWASAKCRNSVVFPDPGLECPPGGDRRIVAGTGGDDSDRVGPGTLQLRPVAGRDLVAVVRPLYQACVAEGDARCRTDLRGAVAVLKAVVVQGEVR